MASCHPNIYLKFSRQRPNTTIVRCLHCLTQTDRFPCPLCFAFPCAVRFSSPHFTFLKPGDRCLASENSTQNHSPHIPMKLNPTIAWRASPTRTPPPICTSAPFLKPRWSEEPWAPRTLLQIQHALFPATEMIQAGRR